MAVGLRHAGQLGCVAAMMASLAPTPGSAAGAGAAATPGAGAVSNVSVPGFPDAIAVDSVTDIAYVALRNPLTAAGTVAVIDMASGIVTATIPVGLYPSQIAVNPVTDVIYVVNSQGGGSVSVIGGASDTVVTTITGLATAPSGPGGFSNLTGLAVDPATNMAYVGISGTGSAGMIDEIDGTTNTVTGAVTGTGLTAAIAVNPATDTAYAASTPGQGQPFAAAVIDLATGAITATIPISGEPRQIAVDPATNTVYTTTWDGPTVAAYSGATNTETGSVDLGGGIVGMTVNPQTDTVYAAVDDSPTGDINVSLVNGAATAVAATIPVAVTLPAWVAVDPSTDTLAVTESDTVAVISLRAPAITSISHVNFTAGAPASFKAAVGTPRPHIHRNRHPSRRHHHDQHRDPERHIRPADRRHLPPRDNRRERRRARRPALHPDDRPAASVHLAPPGSIPPRRPAQLHHPDNRLSRSDRDDDRQAPAGPAIHRPCRRHRHHPGHSRKKRPRQDVHHRAACQQRAPATRQPSGSRSESGSPDTPSR